MYLYVGITVLFFLRCGDGKILSSASERSVIMLILGQTGFDFRKI